MRRTLADFRLTRAGRGRVCAPWGVRSKGAGVRASAGRVSEGRPRRALAARAHYLQVAHPDLT